MLPSDGGGGGYNGGVPYCMDPANYGSEKCGGPIPAPPDINSGAPQAVSCSACHGWSDGGAPTAVSCSGCGTDSGATPAPNPQEPSQGSQHTGYGCVQRFGKAAGEFPNSCSLASPDNGTGTGICAAAEGTYVSAGANGSVCEITVGNGDIVDVGNLGPTLGTSIGLNHSLSVIVVSTNAQTADDLRGWFGYNSFSAEIGEVGFSVTCAFGHNYAGSTIHVCGGGWAGGGGVSYTGGGSYTDILKVIKK
jgi:hypothetical protein